MPKHPKLLNQHLSSVAIRVALQYKDDFQSLLEITNFEPSSKEIESFVTQRVQIKKASERHKVVQEMKGIIRAKIRQKRKRYASYQKVKRRALEVKSRRNGADRFDAPDRLVPLEETQIPTEEQEYPHNVEANANTVLFFDRATEVKTQARKYLPPAYEDDRPRPAQRHILRVEQDKTKFAKSLVLWFDKLLEDNNYSHEELEKRTVLEEAREQRLVGEFRAALSPNLSRQEALAYYDSIRDKAVEHLSESISSLPKVAPALYKDREDRKEKPDAFIRREYAQWLSPEDRWPRKLLNDLDSTLYLEISRYGLSKELDAKIYKTVGRTKNVGTKNDSEELAKLRETKRKSMQRYRAKQKNAKL